MLPTDPRGAIFGSGRLLKVAWVFFTVEKQPQNRENPEICARSARAERSFGSAAEERSLQPLHAKYRRTLRATRPQAARRRRGRRPLGKLAQIFQLLTALKVLKVRLKVLKVRLKVLKVLKVHLSNVRTF